MKNLISLLLLAFSFTFGTAQSKVQNKQEVKKEVQKKDTQKKHHSKQKNSSTKQSSSSKK